MCSPTSQRCYRPGDLLVLNDSRVHSSAALRHTRGAGHAAQFTRAHRSYRGPSHAAWQPMRAGPQRLARAGQTREEDSSWRDPPASLAPEPTTTLSVSTKAKRSLDRDPQLNPATLPRTPPSLPARRLRRTHASFRAQPQTSTPHSKPSVTCRCRRTSIASRNEPNSSRRQARATKLFTPQSEAPKRRRTNGRAALHATNPRPASQRVASTSRPSRCMSVSAPSSPCASTAPKTYACTRSLTHSRQQPLPKPSTLAKARGQTHHRGRHHDNANPGACRPRNRTLPGAAIAAHSGSTSLFLSPGL